MNIQREQHILPAQLGCVMSLAWSPDGACLAVGTDKGILTLWEGSELVLVQSWEVIPASFGGPLVNDRSIRGIAWHPSSGLVATGGVDGFVKIWRPGNVRPFKEHNKHRDWVYGVAFSPDGSKLASSSGDSTILIWPFEKSSAARKITGTANIALTCVAWAPDATCVITGSRKNIVWMYSLNVGEPNRMLRKHTDHVTGVTVGNSGKLLSTSGRDGLVCLWSLETRKLLRTLEGHEAPVYATAFIADTNLLVSGGYDGMIVWDVASGAVLQKIPEAGSIRGLSWNSSLGLLASGGYDGLSLWRMKAAGL